MLIDGELWRAVARRPGVPAGEPVQVTAIDGLTLTVTRSARRP